MDNGSDGWIEGDVSNFVLSSDARWSILPPWMEVSLRNGVSMVDFGDGSYEPYPSVDGLEQWLGLLGYFDEREEFKEFEVVIPMDVPQQVGTKDCGIWVCIFMERIMKGQPLFIPAEDPVAKADQFRTNLAT
ncbi:hypothetical protein L1987_01384 [Smallanthus sonchifolius]|uniref:Uncharacterized protein n=2 Tax=Smallanthus sonchifolius TaxID=185202 RepID=A0ACB9K521_9ASTR|nr:hypothetical protein L1987_01372 [Smallanthus sonchifolius]KAI3827311.1 hypothetical protein L1987_01384 [Smallanthus sonchifolius]